MGGMYQARGELGSLRGFGHNPLKQAAWNSCPPNRLLIGCLAVLPLQVREANQMVEEMMLLANCTGGLGGAAPRGAQARAGWAATLV